MVRNSRIAQTEKATVNNTPLIDNPWIIVLLEKPRSSFSDTAQTLGFVRYERPELRMRIDPFTPDAVMHVLSEIAKYHMFEVIEEGAFTCDELRHPTGEVWRFLARKCNMSSLHATGEFFINSYTSFGSPQAEEFYKHGILDIVFSDADNLLPGEPGYDVKVDGCNEIVKIH